MTMPQAQHNCVPKLRHASMSARLIIMKYIALVFDQANEGFEFASLEVMGSRLQCWGHNFRRPFAEDMMFVSIFSSICIGDKLTLHM